MPYDDVSEVFQVTDDDLEIHTMHDIEDIRAYKKANWDRVILYTKSGQRFELRGLGKASNLLPTLFLWYLQIDD